MKSNKLKRRDFRLIVFFVGIFMLIFTLNSMVRGEKKKSEGFNPKIEVSINGDLIVQEQKSVDQGHSPWKLDPISVAQVFVSLQISPKGIVGEYPIKENNLKLIENNGEEAIVEIISESTPTKKVYLRRLAKQGQGGIWTVVGYDPK